MRREEIRRIYLTYFLDGLPIVLGLEPGTWSVEDLHINGVNYSHASDVIDNTLQALHDKDVKYCIDARSLLNTYENLNRVS